MKQYVVIAGNIGSGKSTLVGKLCERLGWKPYFEPVSENPYLEDFYRQMDRWAFHSQLYFLSDRMRIHASLQNFSGPVVQDRSAYEDAEIFARNLYEQGFMGRRDFETYMNLYRQFVTFLQPPDLVVYMRSSLKTLRERIRLRDRTIEKDIPDQYLLGLNDLYERWIGSWDICPVLTIDTAHYDFVTHPDQIEEVIKAIYEAGLRKQQELFGPL